MRSASRSAASRQAHGPSTSRSAIATALDWKAASRPSDVAFWSTKTITPTATSDKPGDDGRAAAAAGEQDPGAAERGRPDQRVGEAEAAEGDRAGERESDVAEQPAARRRRGAALRLEGEPGAGVGGDPGPAREREQREREPDERRIDAEAAPDAGADARDRSLALRAPQARERQRQPVRRRAHPRRTSMSPMRDVGLEVEHRRICRRAGQGEGSIRVDAVVAVRRGGRSTPMPACASITSATSVRHRDDELADADARVDRRRACRQRRRR